MGFPLQFPRTFVSARIIAIQQLGVNQPRWRGAKAIQELFRRFYRPAEIKSFSWEPKYLRVAGGEAFNQQVLRAELIRLSLRRGQPLRLPSRLRWTFPASSAKFTFA
jgi:hypothetical protein